MNLDTVIQVGFLGNYINEHSAENPSLFFTLFVLGFVFVAIAAYLLGSLNFAIIISGRAYKQDIRQYGSKNAGMTNMMRTYGKKAAALTLLGDALKAILAGIVGYAVLGERAASVAGVACVVGHMFPIFFKFKGGKGVVTTAAAVLMTNPFVFLILLILFVIIVLGTRYISVGSVMCMLIYPFLLSAVDTAITGGCDIFALMSAMLIMALVIYKHKDNIKRLRQGKENKFSFKKSVKAEDINK
ncbi:MAG: glycerol-3-phosphate 1-O-acyltransferase PlsY [Clostridia bacterium]|nr:glycerol-3-phosphate 1-O-acyltransferase PlsY [Clostridia bacterium]